MTTMRFDREVTATILNRTTTTVLDEQDNTVATAEPAADVEKDNYDKDGRLLVSVDGDGNRTTYTYDNDGNQQTVTDPDGNVTTTMYDAQREA